MNQLLLKLALLEMKNVGLAALVVALGYWFMLYDDGAAIVTEIQRLESVAESNIASEKGWENQVLKTEKARAKVDAIQEDYKKQIESLPKEIKPGESLSIVNSIALASNIAVKDIVASNPIPNGVLEIYPTRISAEGRFSDLTLFLFHLMNEKQLWRIEELTIVRSEGRNNPSGPVTIVMNLMLNQYRYNGQDDGAAKPQPAGAKK